MKVLVLDGAKVRRLLPIGECIDVMAGALAALSAGDAYLPLRTVVELPAVVPGLFGLMPAYVGGGGEGGQGGHRPGALGLKALTVFPGNTALGKDIHQGAVLLFDSATGEIQAVMNASAVTSVRTAAVSGVATRLLAREDAGDLAVIGAGIQGRAHLAAMAAVRPLRRALVADAQQGRAEAFVREQQRDYAFPLEVAPSVEEAVRASDLVVTATTSRAPMLFGEWLRPGTHLNLIGGSMPGEREVDGEAVRRSSLFVDRRESTANEAGDYLGALAEGAISGPEHIKAEIGEVLLGTKQGRAASDEITMFKSVGLAVEDVAAAGYLYSKAKEENAGVWVDL